MSFIYIYIYQLIFAITSVIFSWGNKEYMLGDGLNVLRYVCVSSWKTSKSTDNYFIKFISSGIYSFIYPGWMHCGYEPPYILIFLLNQILIFLTVWLSCKFIKNRFFRVILLFSLIYSSYSSSVASKETIISFLLTLLSILFIKKIQNPLNNLRLKIRPNKYKFYNYYILLIPFILFLTRPSYIVLFPIVILIIFNRSKIDQKFNRLLMLLTGFYILSPFLINSFVLRYLFNSIGDYSLIISDYLLRANAYNDNYSDSFEYLVSSLKFFNILKKILGTAFGYRHLETLRGSFSLIDVSHIFMKISVAASMVISYFYIFKNFFFYKSNDIYKKYFINYNSLLLSANLAAVLIYPFPHDRYMLPGVIFSLILVSNSKNNLRKFKIKNNL